MTKDELLARHRFSVLQHARKINNVTLTCSQFNISRNTYYKWLNRFKKYGYAGLFDQLRKPPAMPNETSKSIKQEILNYIIEYPTHGPDYIAYELKSKGIKVSSITIYNFLKKQGLNKRLDRMFYAQSQQNQGIYTNRYIRETAKKIPNHIEAYYTGELIGIDTFYIGTIKGLGRIYQKTAVDCSSSFGFAKVYAAFGSKEAVDFVENVLVPIYKGLRKPLNRILTDNGTEFISADFKKALEKHKITHTRTKVRSPYTNGFTERFNRTLLEEFYQNMLIKKHYTSIEQLLQDLDKYLIKYNFQRRHQGYKLNGKRPCDNFFSGKPQLCLPEKID